MRTLRAVELAGPECWTLLATVPLGRVVFSQRAMPAIGVVRHLVENKMIITRSPLGATIGGRDLGEAGAGEAGTVVCYEADDIDPVTHAGWSVVITGTARRVTDPDDIARYESLLPRWIDYPDDLVAIEPGLVTGRRLTE
jgi:hypothetical protein